VPAPHRLALLHALGGEHAQAAVAELKRTLARHPSIVEAAAALKVHEKTLHRWLTAWGVRKSSDVSR
jgi:hypothetical protein